MINVIIEWIFFNTLLLLKFVTVMFITTIQTVAEKKQVFWIESLN